MPALSFFVLLPLLFSNMLHMFLVRMGIAEKLAIPVAEAVFGANKTIRGFLFVPVCNGVLTAFFFQNTADRNVWENAWTGALFGLIYLISELPNSWIKRRLGIMAGQKSAKFPLLFLLMDKMDSALGVTITALLLFSWTWTEALVFLALAICVHIFFSIVLVLFKIKKSY
jgi:hypothetical protein